MSNAQSATRVSDSQVTLTGAQAGADFSMFTGTMQAYGNGDHWSANLPSETPASENLARTSWELCDYGNLRLRDHAKIGGWNR